MNTLRQPCSVWLELLDRQLVRAKHVLLHGNTSDLALYSGMTSGATVQPACTTFDAALYRYLEDVGFKLVLHFNVADGLQLAKPSMADQFQMACGAAMGGADGQRYENHLGVSGNTSGAMELTRQLLRQKRVPSVIVMHYLDKFVCCSDQLQPDELPLLINLQRAMQGAEFAAQQTALRNTFVGVASQLTSVPGWLYINNPRVALVPVCLPSARVRRDWINTRLPEFHGASSASEVQQADLVGELADRTEGMSLFDIALLPRVSHAEEISLTSPNELVRAARFGKKEDPWKELDSKRLDSAADFLGARVKGQPAVIDHVVSTIQEASVGIGLGQKLAKGGRPKGVFFFVGPTGVGKTEMAKSIAELVFLDNDRMKSFDMGEYHAEHSGDRLAGSPPGYARCEEGGQLTNHVLSEPFSVILFDEIEKAHAKVNDKFLGILEEGRLTDGRGMTAYFDQSILIFTSNIGSDRLMERLRKEPGNLPTYDELCTQYKQSVADHFQHHIGRPELLGRFGDNIIVFDMLRPELVEQLCNKFLEELRAATLSECQIEVCFDLQSISTYLAHRMREPENLVLGGRRVRAIIESTVKSPLSRHIYRTKPAPWSQLHVSMNADLLRITIMEHHETLTHRKPRH